MADELDQILEQKYMNILRPGYKWYSDIFMLSNFQNYEEPIKNFQVRDDDVWVSSFAKAGTTWTQEMVWLIANDLDYEGAKIALIDRFPFIDATCVLDFNNYMRYHPEFKCPDFVSNPIQHLNNLKCRRFIKSHLPWNYLPLQIQAQTTNAKVIHVIRNPKDVCVSYHHHTRVVEAAKGTLEDFFKLFMAGKVVYGPYWNSVMSYWQRRHLSNLLIIKYEDMKKDLPSVIRKVATFLNKNIRDDQMEKLVQHLSFEQMKKNAAVNPDNSLIEIVKQCTEDIYEADGSFMRSGQVDSYKAEMTDEMVDIMDKWIEKNTAGTGLTFN